jgi:hypothetical protein
LARNPLRKEIERWRKDTKNQKDKITMFQLTPMMKAHRQLEELWLIKH